MIGGNPVGEATKAIPLALSVLDQSPVRSGSTPGEAVRETLELAELADRLGYRRYWLAEHHSTMGLASASPEILIGQVGARTARIRVGAGGVMLQHYSPLKVAEQFRMLETLFPGRIDLGLGRAPGSDQRTAGALADLSGGAAPEGAMLARSSHRWFVQQVATLLGFLGEELPVDHPYAGVRAMPSDSTLPEIWLLGSSDQSAAVAAHFGAAFSFAHFINAEGGAQVTRAYAAAFRPSTWGATPRASVAVFVVCADTETEALRLARSRELFVVRLYTGREGPYPSVEEAEAYPYTDRELAIVHHARRRTVAGTPEQVRSRLQALAAEYAVDEVVVVSITHDPKARRRSYELLAEVFGLEASGRAG